MDLTIEVGPSVDPIKSRQYSPYFFELLNKIFLICAYLCELVGWTLLKEIIVCKLNLPILRKKCSWGPCPRWALEWLHHCLCLNTRDEMIGSYGPNQLTQKISLTCDIASCSAEGIFFSASCAASLCWNTLGSQSTWHDKKNKSKSCVIGNMTAYLEGFYTMPQWWQVSKQFLNRKLWRLGSFEKGVF